MIFFKICPGPATQTDPVLCHCFCFVAEFNISFELHVKKRFDDSLKSSFLFYFADDAEVINWAFLFCFINSLCFKRLITFLSVSLLTSSNRELPNGLHG